MNIEDLKGKTYEEVSEKFDAELDAFKEEVSKVTEVEVLNKKEEELMKEMDDINSRLKTVTYKLAAGVDFDGEHFSKNDMAQKIIYFLNKNEVEWSYTLGLFELVRKWKSKDFTDISYNEYDSTLRCLNQVKFKGFTEWRDILAVNEYMKANHEGYTMDTAILLLCHQKHQAIIDRMQLVGKIGPVNEGPLMDGDTVVEA